MRLHLPLLGLTLLACSESPVSTPEPPPVPSPVPSGAVLSLFAPNDTIRVQGGLQLTAVVRSATGDLLPTPTLVWSVDSPQLATISSSGRLHAIAAGRVHVTAAAGEAHAVIAIEVLSIDPSTIVLAGLESVRIGGSLELTASVFAPAKYPLPGAPVTWSSNRADLATVSAAGVVTGVSVGTALITARSGEAAATWTVSVLPSIAGAIQLSGLGHTLHPGDQAQLQASIISTTGVPMDPGLVVWSSSQPSVATVSTTGNVVAVGPGESIILARSADVQAQVTAVVLPVAGSPLPVVGLIAFFRIADKDTTIEVRTGDGALVVASEVHPGLPIGEPPRLSISPLGTSVTFDCAQGLCDLAIPSGITTSRATPCCGYGSYRHPAWLPDGSEMVVQVEYGSIAWIDLPSGAVVTQPGPFYTGAPSPSPDGQHVLYQCDWTQQYDDPADLCQMDATGHVTLYRWNASAPSWSLGGILAYIRSTTGPGGYLDGGRSLVIEPFQVNPDPAGPGAQEYPGFAYVTETAWSPDGSALALVKNGQLWITTMPVPSNQEEFAHVDGTTIVGVSWR